MRFVNGSDDEPDNGTHLLAWLDIVGDMLALRNRILGDAEILPRLLQPSGHSSKPMFHVGVYNTTGNGFTQIRSYCKDLEWKGEGVKSSGGFFVNSADQRSSLRDRCVMEINMSVNRWCCQQNVSCLDHGIMFHKPCDTKNHTFLTLIYWLIETGSQNSPAWYELFLP